VTECFARAVIGGRPVSAATLYCMSTARF